MVSHYYNLALREWRNERLAFWNSPIFTSFYPICVLYIQDGCSVNLLFSLLHPHVTGTATSDMAWHARCRVITLIIGLISKTWFHKHYWACQYVDFYLIKKSCVNNLQFNVNCLINTHSNILTPCSGTISNFCTNHHHPLAVHWVVLSAWYIIQDRWETLTLQNTNSNFLGNGK